MITRLPIFVLLFAFVVFVFSNVIYRVLEVETAVKLRFGQLVESLCGCDKKS
jgi:regulator of protease activity HflC (stomatin/prohibitin superfamily)